MTNHTEQLRKIRDSLASKKKKRIELMANNIHILTINITIFLFKERSVIAILNTQREELKIKNDK